MTTFLPPVPDANHRDLHHSSSRYGSASLLCAVAVTGMGLGILTACAQGWLPSSVGSLANSAGTWVVAAATLSLLTKRLPLAAAAGLLALAGLVIGYYVISDLRGNSSSPRAVAFWLVAALLVGPALGVCAHWMRFGAPLLAAIGTGVLARLFVGEGAYGLTRIANTTYPPYWWTEIVIGGALLAAVAGRQRRSPSFILVSVATSAVTAAAFVTVFGGVLS